MNTQLRRALALAITLGALAPFVASPAFADEQEHHAKIPMDEARNKALALVPGNVVSEELEHERGRWIYSFEIKPAGEKRKIVTEVNIDSDTGEVVSIEIER